MKILEFKRYANEMWYEYWKYVNTISTAGMAIAPQTCEYIIWHIINHKPKVVCDMGSGFTSYVLRFIASENDMIVYSVDDKEEWLGKTKEFLEERNLNTDNMYVWNDHPKMKFDFMIDDIGDIRFRIKHTDQMLNMIKPGGYILADDINGWYSSYFNGACDRMNFKRTNIKQQTMDRFRRFATIARRKG